MLILLIICVIGAAIIAPLMSYLDWRHQKLLDRLLGCFGIGALVALYGMLAASDSPGPFTSRDRSYDAGSNRSSYSPSSSYSASDSVSAFRFTKSSNGYDWNSASEAEKRRMAAAMAEVSTQGNSANYYYDAFETFYDTNNPSIKRQKMADIHTLINAGSSTLPTSQRKY